MGAVHGVTVGLTIIAWFGSLVAMVVLVVLLRRSRQAEQQRARPRVRTIDRVRAAARWAGWRQETAERMSTISRQETVNRMPGMYRQETIDRMPGISRQETAYRPVGPPYAQGQRNSRPPMYPPEQRGPGSSYPGQRGPGSSYPGQRGPGSSYPGGQRGPGSSYPGAQRGPGSSNPQGQRGPGSSYPQAPYGPGSSYPQAPRGPGSSYPGGSRTSRPPEDERGGWPDSSNPQRRLRDWSPDTDPRSPTQRSTTIMPGQSGWRTPPPPRPQGSRDQPPPGWRDDAPPPPRDRRTPYDR